MASIDRPKCNQRHRYGYGKGKRHLKSYINVDIAYSNKGAFESTGTQVYQTSFFFLERLENRKYKQRTHLLCSSDKKFNWKYRPLNHYEDNTNAPSAVFYPYIRVNPNSVVYYLIIDVDNSNQQELLERFRRLGLYPSFMVGKPDNPFSWHLFFGLTHTEWRHNSKIAEMHKKLTLLLFGDVNYSNSCARNPLSLAWDKCVYYFDIPNYERDDLNQRIDAAIKSLTKGEKQAFRRCKSSISWRGTNLKFIEENNSKAEEGRNCATFYHLIKFSRKFCEKYYKEILHHDALEQIKSILKDEVKNIPKIVNGLSTNEVNGIIKSIARYHTRLFFSGRYDVKKLFLDKAKDNDVFEQLMNDKGFVAKIHSRLTHAEYLEYSEQFNCTLNQIKYHVRMARAFHGIEINKNSSTVVDTVWEMKRAEQQYFYDTDYEIYENKIRLYEKQAKKDFYAMERKDRKDKNIAFDYSKMKDYHFRIKSNARCYANAYGRSSKCDEYLIKVDIIQRLLEKKIPYLTLFKLNNMKLTHLYLLESYFNEYQKRLTQIAAEKEQMGLTEDEVDMLKVKNVSEQAYMFYGNIMAHHESMIKNRKKYNHNNLSQVLFTKEMKNSNITEEDWKNYSVFYHSLWYRERFVQGNKRVEGLKNDTYLASRGWTTDMNRKIRKKQKQAKEAELV